MRKESIYICDICDAEYESEEKAIQCENSHCKPESIVAYKYRYRSEYPNVIIVKMLDGKIMEYRNN